MEKLTHKRRQAIEARRQAIEMAVHCGASPFSFHDLDVDDDAALAQARLDRTHAAGHCMLSGIGFPSHYDGHTAASYFSNTVEKGGKRTNMTAIKTVLKKLS